MTAALARRLEKLEAQRANEAAPQASIAAQIIAARQTFTPTHTRAELDQLARQDGLSGRVARGWLRIGFFTENTRRGERLQPFDAEAALAATMGALYADPLRFILFSFEWGSEPALQVVKLPSPWNLVYECEYGPEAWSCEFLDQIGDEVRRRGFDGRTAVEPIRMATASGHGISKSTTSAWLALWIASTRPNSRGTVTANTAQQLSSKTWGEIGKWHRRCITGDWFTITTGKGAMRMSHIDAPEAWRVDAQTSREENSESFAGQHAADSTSWYLFDEASAIPDKIWEVAEGGLSDGESHIYAFGNPTRSTGRFADCFGKLRHRWISRQIDSRTVSITNKALLQGWIDDHGIDSDMVRVRVLGQFPKQSSLQFISADIVQEAMRRETPYTRGEPAVVGVDVARFGPDSSVIRTRIGRDARSWAPIRMHGADTMAVAGRVAEHINELRSLGLQVVVFIDAGGVGGGVCDRLRQLGFTINDVNFGGRPMDPRKHANVRSMMYDGLRGWLRDGGVIEDDEDLLAELTAIEYSFTPANQVLLERKELLKARTGSSPDDADALALTFAQPVAVDTWLDQERREERRREVDAWRRDPIGYTLDRARRGGHDPFKSRRG